MIQAFGHRAKTEAWEEKAQGSSLSTRESWLRSVVSPLPCKTLARSLGGERSRGSVPLGPWLAGCHGAEVAATSSLSPSLTKIYFISAPTLPSPKLLASRRGFLLGSLLSSSCHVLRLENAAWYAGTNWGLLASQMVSHGPLLWGTGERTPPLPLPATHASATTATATLLTRALLENCSCSGCRC